MLYTLNTDGRGSTSVVVDSLNKGITGYKYDEFGGTEVLGNATFENEVCYTGQVYDKETGDYYYNARYYNPEDGRFVTVDTYRGEFEEPQSLHLYSYCANNPINFTDPSGHSPWSARLSLWDYAKIHKVVQSVAVYSLNRRGQRGMMETFVSKNGKKKKGQYGYLDVYNYSNNTFYEVKTRRQIDSKNTMKQIAKYKKWHTRYNSRKVRLGYNGYIQPRDFYYGAHKVHMEYRGYSWQTTGRIYYTTSYKKKVKQRRNAFVRKGATVALAFGGALAAGTIAGIGRSLIPGFNVLPAW